MIKTCIVTNEIFPNSIRLEKEIRTFQGLGHEIHVVCLASDGQPLEEVLSGSSVHRIRSMGGFVGKLLRLIYKVVFVNIQVLWKLRMLVKQYDFQVLFVRDMSFVWTACLAGKLYGSKVVYDVNDRYPLAMKAWGLKRSWNEKLLMNASRMERLERRCLRTVDHIVAANHPYVDHFVKMGIPGEKITLMPNYVDLTYIDGIERSVSADLGDNPSKSFVIFYSGSFGRHRGLDTAIRAVPFLVERIPDLRFVLIGPAIQSEMFLKQELEELAEHLGVSQNVIFMGFLEFEKMVAFLNKSDLCLIPFKRNPHTDSIVPHKLFEYMSQAKPVVTTDVKAVRRIVDSEGCGIVVPAEDPAEMAKAIITLHDNPSYAAELGMQGRKAVETKYNWREGEKAFSEFLCHMEDVLRAGDE